MLPIPANVKLVVLLILVGGIGALHGIQTIEPTWSWIGAVVQVAGLLEAFFTLPNNASKRLASAAGKGGAVLLVVFAARSLTACFGQGAVQPAADFAACVASNALAGDSISQIVQSCGGDAAAVIASLFSSKNADVPGTKAFAEALSARSVLMQSLDGGGASWKPSP